MAMISLVVVLWIAFGCLYYGMAVHYFQRKYQSIAADTAVGDRIMAMFTGLFGPIAVMAFFLNREINRDRNTPPIGWML